jgi:hypothetical protein
MLCMRKKADFRKFIETIRKSFRDNAGNGKITYENTYLKLEGNVLTNSFVIKNDTISLSMKKYSYSPPGSSPSVFYRITGAFAANIYYNAFLKLNFDNELTARKFYSKTVDLIEAHKDV